MQQEEIISDERGKGLITSEALASGNSSVFRCFMSKECLWPRGALGHSIKACGAPGSASSSLGSLSSRNEVSLSPLHLSLWAELLSWGLLRLILGLPQLGPATELLKGCDLFPL